MSAATPVLVIGTGNRLRRDDGAGWRLAEGLRQRCRPPVEVLVQHQLTPELAAEITRARAVLFIDAYAVPAAPTPARTAWLTDVAARGGSAAFSHQLSPPSLLALAHSLYGRQPPAWCLWLAGECFGLGDQLSRTGTRALKAAQPLLEAWLREHANDA